MKIIRNQPPERLTELARGIVTNEYLVADASMDWAMSLTLLAPAILELKNLGCVMVPVAPHSSGYWLNGHVPGVTLTCLPINRGDAKRIMAIANRMNKALWPE